MAKTQKIPTEEARKKLGDLLNAAQFAGEHAEITRHGKTAGLLVPPDWYDTATTAIAEVKALRKELAELRRRALSHDAPSPAVGAETWAPTSFDIDPRVTALTDRRLAQLAEWLREKKPDWYADAIHGIPEQWHRHIAVSDAVEQGLIRETDLIG